ncbi:MAG: NUDIX domain-containing protein [Firmicutes bacterium]|nr:NUDIX domain-containing protein [Bacillota bacterium]
MPNITLTTMVMIENPATGEVLVQDRLLSFKGLAFPGGHVDEDESLYDCAVREVLEETGLAVRNLQFCGIKHECWRETPEGEERRYFVFLYKTRDFAGTAIDTKEGLHFWATPEALKAQRARFTPWFEAYLPMFFDEHSEAFCLYPKPGDYTTREFVYY